MEQEKVRDIGLTETEVLQGIFKTIQKKLDGKEITLKDQALSEVANDSDGHRERVGCMGYDAICIIVISGTTWAIAVGHKCGSYPGEYQYKSDLVALKMGDDISELEEAAVCEAFLERIEREDYFKNSILIGLCSGIFGTLRDSKLGKKVFNSITEDLICQEPIKNTEVVSLDLSPFYDQTAKYFDMAIDQLSVAIIEALTSESST